MPCLIAALALLAPRVTMVLLVIFSDYIGNAYQTFIWPFLGFFFMPFTTIAYAFGINSNGSISGWYLVVVVLAVLMDLGALGGGAHSRNAAFGAGKR